MSNYKKGVICFTVFLLLLVGLFPPWAAQVKQMKVDLGFSFILSPPHYGHSQIAGDIAFGRLLLQWIILIICGAVALFIEQIKPNITLPKIKPQLSLIVLLVVAGSYLLYSFATETEPAPQATAAVVSVTPVSPATTYNYTPEPPTESPASAESNLQSKSVSQLTEEEIRAEHASAQARFKQSYPDIFANRELLAEANKRYYAKIDQGKTITDAMLEAGQETREHYYATRQ